MQLWSKLSPFWTERSVRNTYRKMMEMHRAFFPHFSVHFAWCTVLWQQATRTVMVVPQLQSAGGIFAPGALIGTLTLGPRLENGLASKLLEGFFFHTEGLCFSRSRGGQSPWVTWASGMVTARLQTNGGQQAPSPPRLLYLPALSHSSEIAPAGHRSQWELWGGT